MESYKYKPGMIVNNWKILYKYNDKYKYSSGQKNYAYRVRCIFCGEEKDFYGIAGILSNKCLCKKIQKKLNILKKNYINKLCNNGNGKIINFFFVPGKGIVCIYKNFLNNKICKKQFYLNSIINLNDSTNIIKILKPIKLTIKKYCENLLYENNFMLCNKSYTKINDLIKDFKITESGVISYLKNNDLKGLKLYALFTKHKYDIKQKMI